MEPVVIPLQPRGFGSTMRRDAWWAQPLVTFLVLGRVRRLLPPGPRSRASTTSTARTSPRSTRRSCSARVRTAGSAPGRTPGWWPAALPFSAALLILWAPGGFRFTCYYYRGAYYKAFWADPPSCAVGEPRTRYRGEHSFPLILQNVHRYFLYLALAVPDHAVARRLDGDVVHRRGHRRDDVRDRRGHPGPGGEHRAAERLHARLPFVPAPGRRTPRSLLARIRPRRRLYDAACRFNCNHNRWAWASLFGVALADLYVRLCSMGILTDWRIL